MSLSFNVWKNGWVKEEISLEEIQKIASKDPSYFNADQMWKILAVAHDLAEKSEKQGGFDKLTQIEQEMLSTAVDVKFARATSINPITQTINLALHRDLREIDSPGAKYGYLYKDTGTVYNVSCQSENWDTIAQICNELVAANKTVKAKLFFTSYAASSLYHHLNSDAKIGIAELGKYLKIQKMPDVESVDRYYSYNITQLEDVLRVSVKTGTKTAQLTTCAGFVIPVLEDRTNPACAFGTEHEHTGSTRGAAVVLKNLYELHNGALTENYCQKVMKFYVNMFKDNDQDFLNLVLKPTVFYYTRSDNWDLVNNLVLDTQGAEAAAKDIKEQKAAAQEKGQKVTFTENDKTIALAAQADGLLAEMGINKENLAEALINTKTDNKDTAAHLAAKSGNTEKLEKILGIAPELADAQNDKGRTPGKLLQEYKETHPDTLIPQELAAVLRIETKHDHSNESADYPNPNSEVLLFEGLEARVNAAIQSIADSNGEDLILAIKAEDAQTKIASDIREIITGFIRAKAQMQGLVDEALKILTGYADTTIVESCEALKDLTEKCAAATESWKKPLEITLDGFYTSDFEIPEDYINSKLAGINLDDDTITKYNFSSIVSNLLTKLTHAHDNVKEACYEHTVAQLKTSDITALIYNFNANSDFLTNSIKVVEFPTDVDFSEIIGDIVLHQSYAA